MKNRSSRWVASVAAACLSDIGRGLFFYLLAINTEETNDDDDGEKELNIISERPKEWVTATRQ